MPKQRFTLLILSVLLGFSRLALGLGPADLLPPEKAYHLEAKASAGVATLAWDIADGYYLYRKKFKFVSKTPGVTLGEAIFPTAGKKHDAFFGEVEIYRGHVVVALPLSGGSASPAAELEITSQGCADAGVCFPPYKQQVSLSLPSTAGAAALEPPPGGQAEPAASLAPEQDRIAASLKNDSIWLVAASFFGFGLLMAFSPCIFPMIPILSGIIVGHGHRLTPFRAFTLSLSYVLAAALAYTVFGVLAGLFGGNLQAVFQNPWVVGGFSGLFVLLSLSMFGFYELQMPSFIQTRVTTLSHQQKGGTLAGAAAMGALSALIVGPCMAAPLAGALIYIGQTGDAVLGGLALFAMGLGMGAPLIAIGLSAGRLLPRAGVWMNTVKAVFGVGMLAVAVWLLERILPAPVTLCLWALLLILPAVFLSALDALPQGVSNWRKLWKGLGVAMLTYGVLMLVGVANGSGDPFRPMRAAAPAEACAGTPDASAFRRVGSVAELQTALQAAQAEGRWAMLDYYADWCVSCKEMERDTFADTQVRRELGNFVLLQADVTANADEHRALLQSHGLFGPPAILFFGPDSAERKQHRLIGFKGPEEFLAHVRDAVR